MTTRDALINAMKRFQKRANDLGHKILLTQKHFDLENESPINIANKMTDYAIEKTEFETLQMVLDEIKFILDETRD